MKTSAYRTIKEVNAVGPPTSPKREVRPERFVIRIAKLPTKTIRMKTYGIDQGQEKPLT